jgi:biotin synthase
MSGVTAELAAILERAKERPKNLSAKELATLVAAADGLSREAVRVAAREVKRRHCGNLVSIRGIVELGNICSKDCYYCGIRKSNSSLQRYRLKVGDVVRMARTNRDLGYGSIVLQGGEIESEENTRFIEECLEGIAELDLGVTLSLGEQTEDVYRRWKEAGASRYLLRIETSNPALYARLHPPGHSWERRRECLAALGRCGYQVGTGVMCALPGQTAADLADDIVFYGEIDADMIGMGPYIPHPDTPLAAQAQPLSDAERLELGLNMIAATRLYLHDVNIAATTALQALADDGRERGILAGANVVMPNVTDVGYRARYQLYAGKPCLNENASLCRGCLERRIESIGEKINWRARGDSPHYHDRLRRLNLPNSTIDTPRK